MDSLFENDVLDDEMRFDPCVWDDDRIEATKTVLLAERIAFLTKEGEHLDKAAFWVTEACDADWMARLPDYLREWFEYKTLEDAQRAYEQANQ